MSRLKKLTFLAVILVAHPLLAATAYGVYGLHPTGSTRVLAMGGAFVGLADDATAVVTNPAGLALTRWGVDLQGTENRVVNREGDIDSDGQKDGLPYNYSYAAGSVKLGFLGLGAGYTSPYEVRDNFGGLSTTTQTLHIESIDASMALSFAKTFAIGVTGHQEKVTLGHKNDTTGADFETTAEKFYPTGGIVYRPHPKLGLGVTYRPERRYDIDDSLNDGLGGSLAWFQDVVIPAKLTLGLAYRMKSRLTWVGDIDVWFPAEDAIFVGSDPMSTSEFSFNRIREKQYEIWHGGFELTVIDNKNLEFIWRGGGYREPPRLFGQSGTRFHFTMGVEVRFRFLKFSAAYDQARDFTSFAHSVGISIADLR